MPAARSVATSQMIDAAAKANGQTTYQTPVGFKYIGQLIREDKIALGGEESAGLTIRGHVPEKDGILACLLVAEMLAARGGSIAEQIKRCSRNSAANSGRCAKICTSATNKRQTLSKKSRWTLRHCSAEK